MAARGHPLVYSAYRRIAADGRPLGVVRPPLRVSRADLLKGNVIGCLTAVYDTAVFGRVEMPPLRRRQDYGLWLGLLRQVAHAHGLPEVLADYRVRPASLSGGKLGAAKATWTLYREIEGLGRPRAAFYLAHNLARGRGQAGAIAASAAQEGPEVGGAREAAGVLRREGEAHRRRRRGRRPGRRPGRGRGPGPRPPRRSPSSRAGAR